jgi:hypothetical protein
MPVAVTTKEVNASAQQVVAAIVEQLRPTGHDDRLDARRVQVYVRARADVGRDADGNGIDPGIIHQRQRRRRLNKLSWV